MSEKPCGAYFFAFFENFFVPILTSGGLAAVSSSFFAALSSAFGKYDVVHIHAEGPAFFTWLPKMFGKRVVVTVHGIDWQREKWQSGLGSKFIHQGEKNAAKYADEVIVLSKGVQDYFKETYGRKTHFIPNGVNRPQIREAKLISEQFGLEKDSYILFLGRLVPEKGIRYLVEAFKNIKTDKKLVIAGGSSDTDSFMEELKELAKGDDRIFSTANTLQLSKASVTSYLPYEKGVYFPSTADKEKISVGAERQRRYRAVRKLRTEPTEGLLRLLPETDEISCSQEAWPLV
ncbi:MAG: glycosyltransferase family 4 protein [Faecalibacterium prausnitzii]